MDLTRAGEEQPLFSTLCWLCCLLLAFALPATAQLLPPHPPLRILIVSDEVNPHGLPPEELTQPGEISAALLVLPRADPAAYDVLIYFAHRIPDGADAQARQEAFVTAVDGFLAEGGGVISFHHGIFLTAGKESMQDLLGAQASGTVVWDTIDGQNIIAVAPEHFIAGFGIDYPATTSYEDLAHGIPLDDYPFFNNTPDELYPNFELVPAAGEIEMLFASDYDAAPHILGYVERRPEWAGVVVVYQPGEFQPDRLLVTHHQLGIEQ